MSRNPWGFPAALFGPGFVAALASMALGGCSGTEAPTGVVLRCETSDQCPSEQRCTDAQRCLPVAESELELLGIEPLAPNALQLSFAQPIAGVAARENFLISELESESALASTGAQILSTDRTRVTVFTEFQTPGLSYSLRVVGLVGVNGQDTPEGGVAAQFQGFVENRPRALVLNTPAEVTQGLAFLLTVSAVTVPTTEGEPATLIAEIASELDWTMSAPGEVQVVSASDWELGIRSYELALSPAPPLADGAATAVTLQASARDDRSIRGSSSVVQLKGAVGLARFEVTAPAGVQVDVPFPLEITAIGSDGRPLTSFSSPVRLTPVGGIGAIEPSTIDEFTQGRSTTLVRYDALNPNLEIRAERVSDPSRFGTSPSIQSGLSPDGALAGNLVAVPLSADRVRLDWTRIQGAEQYRISVSQTGADFSEVATVLSTLFSFEVTALEELSAYRFRVEGLAAGETIGVVEAMAAPKKCTTLSIEEIAAPLGFLTALSPYCIENPNDEEIRVSAALTAQPGVQILFGPATQLRLSGANAAIAFVGSPDAPIILTSLERERPWGGLILDDDITGTTFSSATGEFESGSRLSHVVIDGASASVHGLDIAVPLALNRIVVQHTRPASNRSVRLRVDSRAVIEESQFLQSFAASIRLSPSARLELARNAWGFNSSTGTGGAWAVDAIDESAALLDRGSFYFQNESQSFGGAVSAAGRVSTAIEDCVFKENVSTRGGALHSDGTVTIRRSEFESNVASGEGGAVNAFRGSVEDSTFTGNSSERGGALHSFNVDQAFSVVRVRASNNSASVRGGALAGYLRVSNSLLTSNEAPLGGAVSLRSRRSAFIENECTDNTAQFGGCLAILEGLPEAPFTFARNNVFDNHASEGTGANLSNEACEPELLVLDSTYWGNGELDGLAEFGVEQVCASPDVETRVTQPVSEPWPRCADASDAVTCVGPSSL